jgi:hypothetical protein
LLTVFLITLNGFDTTDLTAAFVNDCATYDQVNALNAEELNEHIRDNIHDTDFCSVCKRWSFIYNADVHCYDESVVISIHVILTLIFVDK